MRRGLILSFSVLLGCSGSEPRSDAEPRAGLPVVSGVALDDTSSALWTNEGEREQPAVLFRCKEGRLDAYLVTTVTVDGGISEEQMVPISLDSAPGCDEKTVEVQ